MEYDPPHTIEMIRHGIETAGHDYVFVEADPDIVERLKDVRPDLVFNRSEGVRGESRESHIPSILEMLGIPYVGPNVLTTAICLNKGWTKKLLTYHGIQTPTFHIVASLDEARATDFRFPVILKPNEEGSSVGVNEDNVVRNTAQLEKKLTTMLDEYEQPILAEQFIEGREFSTGILGSNKGEPEVLPILEVDFTRMPQAQGVLGQRAKTIYDALDHYVCPAEVDDITKAELERISLEVCKHLDVRDFARIDFRMNDNAEVFFLEINPLPGMDFDPEEQDISFYPYMAMQAGYTYDDLIRRLIESAASRYGLNG